LTNWTIQFAANRVRKERDSIASMAADIGYKSETVFDDA
jgi:hypothetical protein